MLGTDGGALAGMTLASAPLGAVVWFRPPAPKLLPPAAARFAEPPLATKTAPTPFASPVFNVSSTLRPPPPVPKPVELVTPKFVTLAFGGKRPAEIAAMTLMFGGIPAIGCPGVLIYKPGELCV